MRIVLVKNHGWEEVAGNQTWGHRWFVARVNPYQLTDDIREAARFETIQAARAVKRGLFLDRKLAARRLPEWL